MVRSGNLTATRAEILQLVSGAAAIVSDVTVCIDEEVLNRAGEQLKVVANFAVGFDNIDLDACAVRGVVVTNTPGVLTAATAELAVALTLAATRGLSQAEAELRAGRWSTWDPSAYCTPQVSGATVGVIGMGRIGTEYARMMKVFGTEILYCSRSPKPDIAGTLDAQRVSVPELLSRADIISVHVSASSSNRHLIDADALALVKPMAVLVNTSRGSVVDSQAVATALREQRLWGAGLDVYEFEPSVPRELLEAPRAVLLPHIGSATRPARDDMAKLVAHNVVSILQGQGAVTPVPCEPRQTRVK